VSKQSYDQVVDSLASELHGFVDPRTGRSIVRNVYKRGDIYSGPFFNAAADLQVGFEDGYRSSWQTALGGAPPQLLEPNLKKWSGDHGSFDYAITPGVLFSSIKLATGEPRIIDIAPTVLKLFGVPIPSDIDGKPLF
jgi:predicted AlkP superfamily phosphohydrolase/phosphomutase